MPIIDKEREEIGATVCCKKWVNGILKRYYSRRGCSGGGVLCSEPDPPKPEDGDEEIIGDGNGNEGTRNCNQEARAKGLRMGMPGYQEFMKECMGAGRNCPEECRDKGFHMGLPGYNECIGECMKGVEPVGCDPPCVPPQRCVQGKCVGKEIPPIPGTDPCDTAGYQLTAENGFAGGVGEGQSPWDPIPGTTRSSQWEGHYVWNAEKGQYVNILTPDVGVDTVCKKGWIRKPDDAGNIWCCPEGIEPEPTPGSEFQWGEGLQGLMGRVTERANYLLDYPRGLTPSERQGVINYAVESTKAGERGQIQSSQDALARQGLLGSGYQFEQEGDIRRDTRNRETQVRREFGIDELDRRFKELMGTTGMVQGLTGTLMQGEQIPEILSGARRAEGQAAMNAFYNFVNGQMAGQNNNYWNSIFNQPW